MEGITKNGQLRKKRKKKKKKKLTENQNDGQHGYIANKMGIKPLWSRWENSSCFLLDVHSATHLFKIYEIYQIKYNS